MPVNVPDNPKVYTTKYQNWRGVDYTNDPSNVWYRRSPNGLNMLPNLDGQPFKRNGWKVEFSSADFVSAVYGAYEAYSSSNDYIVGDICKRSSNLYRCTTNALQESWDSTKWELLNISDVEQYKVDYFELGGADYLFFYTSVGCFYCANELKYIAHSYEKEDQLIKYEQPYYYKKSVLYKRGEYVWRTVNGETKYYRRSAADMTTPEETFVAGNWREWDGDDCRKPFPPVSGASINHGKSFFFEGGGRAAYYLFVGNKMYWFDGSILHEAHPTIPTVLTMCSNTGAGTLLEAVNMLTDWRAVEYTCAEGAAVFTIPERFEVTETKPTGIFSVSFKDGNGEWELTEAWSMEDSGRSIRMTNTPPETFKGQTNLRVIYKPSTTRITETEITSEGRTLNVTKTTVYNYTQEYRNGSWVDTSSPIDPTPTYSYSLDMGDAGHIASVKYPMTDNVHHELRNPSDINSWITDSPYLTHSINSYGNNVTISAVENGKNLYTAYPSVAVTSTTTTRYSAEYYIFQTRARDRIVTTVEVKQFTVRISYTQIVTEGTSSQGSGRDAFSATSKSLVYGNGIINQAFLTASTLKNYMARLWFSAATNPLYFPDTNYIEVGATDKAIMGLIKVDDYLGVVKQGSATDTSVYLAYATSFEDITTYAVKQSVNGIGAISNGAFNILNGEPLFLSAEGVMGIEPSEDESRKIRNRSYYINKKLLTEPSLESAFSFVFNGMYWLCVNNHCYVLDGSQKVAWENTKTNLQYESYYLENIPAKCFAQKDGLLWFADNLGNVCRFKSEGDELLYVDAYNSSAIDDEFAINYKADTQPAQNTFAISDLSKMQSANEVTLEGLFPDVPPWETPWDIPQDWYDNGLTMDCEREYYEVSSLLFRFWVNQGYTEDGGLYANPSISLPYTTSTVNGVTRVSVAAGYDWSTNIGQYGNLTDAALDGYRDYSFTVVGYEAVSASEITVGDVIQHRTAFYTVSSIDVENQTVTVECGVPIKAVWGTIADDDGSAHYYKKLQKRGSLVAVMPMSDSGVKVYLVPDEKEPVFVGETDIGNHVLPFNYYLRKKVKNYKRLQIICENASYNDGFGIDEIIKSYTMGNYAKK